MTANYAIRTSDFFATGKNVLAKIPVFGARVILKRCLVTAWVKQEALVKWVNGAFQTQTVKASLVSVLMGMKKTKTDALMGHRTSGEELN